MASAAAVGADSMESPIDDTTTADGAYSASVRPNPLVDSDDDDDDADGAVNGETAINDDDLFGDGDEEEEEEHPTRRRELDDEELDSGDDLERADRLPEDEDEAPPTSTKTLNIAEYDLPRTVIPKGSDGETYLLKMPDFMEIDAKAFSLSSFRPPTTDHHRKGEPSATFSAYGTAMTTIRWRRSPSKPSELQSNARILRWSDGSLTLQLASDPLTQYELPSNSLAPPQINPPKPTPTSVLDKRNRTFRKPYNPKQDGFTYLALPDIATGLMRVTNKITTGLQVESADSGGAGVVDDALEKLQESVAGQQRRREEAYGQSADNILDSELADPEMAKKRAEAAEKEKDRARRRLENSMNRERDRTGRVAMGRSGGRTGGGLSVEDLEGGAGAGRSAGGRPSKPKKRRQLRDEYSDEDDYMGRRRTREDEYDMEDDFMADSDEEPEAMDDGDDIDEELEQQEKRRQAQRARSGTPKRSRADDEDAEGDDDDDVPGSGPAPNSPKQVKRRRVIDDEDDEDE